MVIKALDISGVIKVSSESPGPRVVFFGGIHGDETSGVRAVERITQELQSAELKLITGTLIMAQGNEEALREKKRYLKYNLNRLFTDAYSAPMDESAYEYQRAQELKPLLQYCDYFLDMHSAPIAKEPFMSVEQKYLTFFTGLGIDKMIIDWNEFSSGPIGGDAENYANQHGAQSATLESGQNFDEAANAVAYQTSLHLLSKLEMIQGHELQTEQRSPEIFQIYKVITKKTNDFRYAGEVKNFKFIPKGEVFAYEDNTPLVAEDDTYIHIPMRPEMTKIGEEICYLGRKLS